MSGMEAPHPSEPAGHDDAHDDPDAVDRIVGQWAVVRPELDTRAMAVIGRIYRLAEAIGNDMELAYQAFGISRGEFDVLATLRRAGDPALSPGRLSDELMITTGGCTGRLDRLERAGLLERSPDPDDRRGVRVTLTDEGREVVDRAVEAGLEVQRSALAVLSPDQVDRLDALLHPLLLANDR